MNTEFSISNKKGHSNFYVLSYFHIFIMSFIKNKLTVPSQETFSEKFCGTYNKFTGLRANRRPLNTIKHNLKQYVLGEEDTIIRTNKGIYRDFTRL